MATWRYIATELDGSPIGDLPLHGVSFVQRLNTVPTLSASLLIADDDLLASIFVDGTEPLRRAILAERDGVPIWSGVWLTRAYKTSERTFTLSASGWWYFVRRRLISVEKIYTGTDQAVIADDLVENVAQADKAGGALGIVVEGGAHGVTRDREYPHYELKPVGEAVEQLADVEGGFDWSVDTTYDEGALVHTFRTSYPRRGRLAGASGFVFELGRNVVDLEVVEDGTSCVNSVTAVGDGEGDSMLRVTVTDSEVLDAGYPLIEEQVSYKSVSEIETLDAHARAHLAARRLPVEHWTATVLADADPPLGSYITGDDARIRVQPGDNHRWPDGHDQYHRMIDINVQVPNEGTETVKLTFGETLA
jgi:hypothetical protein